GTSVRIDANRPLTVNGTLTIANGSQIAVQDGQTLNAGSIVNNGTLAWTIGTINLTNSDLVIGPVGPLSPFGSSLTIDSTKTLGVSGTTSIAAGATLSLNGGQINTGNLDTGGVPARLNWTTGTLNLTNSSLPLAVGTGGPLGNNPSIVAGQTLIVAGTTQ